MFRRHAKNPLTDISAIGISIGENIFVSRLLSEVPRFASTIPPQAVIASGALNLKALTSSPSILYGLRQAYRLAISSIMVFATVAICISILATLGMQRLNLVKISRDRELAEKGIQNVSSNSAVDEGLKCDNDLHLLDAKQSACEVPQ